MSSVHLARPAVRLLCAALFVLACATAAGAATPVRRYVVAAGSNDGGPDRVPLRYAVTDAEHFADVLRSLGGVADENRILLREPTVRSLFDALRLIRDRVVTDTDGRAELILYYSGHADEAGLLLGGDRISYQSLRDALEDIPADVRIAVLDACASGAITRLKGGQREKAFLVDEASQARGQAFLTSASENEAAQESDIIGASFFTHHLVSGLRGAADASGDGRVTLNEAYQHAFHETLAHTTETRGGAQHPAYDIDLVGTGDVVMTDLSETSAGLFLGKDLDGRLYVRNEQRRLVVEVAKPAGRTIEIGLEPGRYDVHFEQSETLGLAKVQLGEEERLELTRSHFKEVDRDEAVVLRGRPRQVIRPMRLARRHRLRIGFGYVAGGPNQAHLVGVRTENFQAGGFYGWWPSERVMISIGANALANTVATEIVAVGNVLLGCRLYLTDPSWNDAIRPYVSLGVGPYIADVVGSFVGQMGAPGGYVGAGVDLPLGRWVMLDADAGYNIAADFRQEVAGRRNYSGPRLAIGVSFTFGRGLRGR